MFSFERKLVSFESKCASFKNKWFSFRNEWVGMAFFVKINAFLLEINGFPFNTYCLDWSFPKKLISCRNNQISFSNHWISLKINGLDWNFFLTKWFPSKTNEFHEWNPFNFKGNQCKKSVQLFSQEIPIQPIYF